MKVLAYVWRVVLVFFISCLWVGVVIAKIGNLSVVNIGALFTSNSAIGRSLGPAIVAAVDDVNSDSTILNHTKINLILSDTNCSGFVGTVEGTCCFSLCL